MSDVVGGVMSGSRLDIRANSPLSFGTLCGT